MQEQIRRMPTRQVHLDFHTGPYIPDVGKQFDKSQFQQALKLGNLSSITVFAKCHHGLCYYPSKVSRQHPTMEPGFDLTGAMVDAAHEIGVAAPIYITLGFSEDDALRHPEWCIRDREGKIVGGMPESAPGDAPRPLCNWFFLCPSGDYAELEYRLVEEISERYQQVDGLFIDIVYMNNGQCWCDNCMRRMREMGRDPYLEADNRANYEETHHLFAQRCTELLHAKHPHATIFFNSGGAEIYYPERHRDQTHFEMEDLPSAWGGYDKFMPRASVMRRGGEKQILGMTGKFHSTWGEFGGYKNPDALKYEALTMGMYGVACSVGDQMPPCGRMDLETYRIIGEAYRAYEAYEPWFYGETNTTRLGVYLSGNTSADEGLARILQEGQQDFDVILPGDPLERFDAVILPDCVSVSDEEAARLEAFRGAILFTGDSLVKDGHFQISCGCDFIGRSGCDVDYFRAVGPLSSLWVRAPFLCVVPGNHVKQTDGETIGELYEPYFNRTKERFCSHRYTPYSPNPSAYPAAVRKGNRIYFAHKLASLYNDEGAQLHRDVLLLALRQLYTPVCQAKMPSAGRVRFVRQEKEHRYVLHMTYAQPIRRGPYLVLEDMPELRDIPVVLRVPEPIQAVRYAGGEAVPFVQDGETVRLTVPTLQIYAALELVY